VEYQRTENLHSLLKEIEKEYKPLHCDPNAKKIWDNRKQQYKLDYFTDYQFVVVIFSQEKTYSLVEVDNIDAVRAISHYSFIGQTPLSIYNLDLGQCISAYVPPDEFGYKSAHTFTP
jgi:hypothetical protein